MPKTDEYDFCFGPDQVLPASGFKTWEPDGTIKIPMSNSGAGAYKPSSVYSFLKDIADQFGDKPALAVKRDGTWKYWSYKEYFDTSYIAAKAMIKLGLERFHGVCIMGFNCPEWLFANFGCIFAGGFSAGVYTTNSPEACRHLADNCQAQIIVVEDLECLNKFLAVKRFLPNIKAIIQWTGVPGAPGVLSWAELMAIGMHESDEELKKRLSLAAVNQCCSLIYTSGTTGPPKGVMCSQDQMTWTSKIYRDHFEISLGEGEERIVSYLPLSHLAAQMTDIYSCIANVGTCYFAQPDALKGSLINTLVEVQPTGILAVPRIWEKIYERMQEVAASSGGFKKTIGNWAKQQGLNYYTAIKEGRELSAYEKWKYSIAKSLIFNKVKAALGLLHCKHFVSGSAPISAEVLDYFMSIDIPIMEGYGLSESLSMTSLAKCSQNGFKVGAVGKVWPQNEVVLIDVDERRDGEGEICIRGRNICMGYLRMPEKTNEAIDNDGLLHSGDIGYLDEDGFLYITGRLKELVITAGGENIPPVLIEEAIKKELPFISQAMLIGDKRKYLSILLTLKEEVDLDTAMPLGDLMPSCIEMLKEIGSHATTVQQARKEIQGQPQGALAKAIYDGIIRYNRLATSQAQRVQKFTLLPHDFSHPTEELNNTLKLKRQFVMEKYADLIDAMYNESSLDTNGNLRSKL